MRQYTFRHKNKEETIIIMAMNKEAARVKLAAAVLDISDWKLQH